MISRTVSSRMFPLVRAATTSTRVGIVPSRAFSQAATRYNAATAAVPLPMRRPIGAFRGGVFGFLSGAVFAGASVYYYILSEYRVSNEMLTEDIYALQAATSKLSNYITELETKVDQLQKKKKK